MGISRIRIALETTISNEFGLAKRPRPAAPRLYTPFLLPRPLRTHSHRLVKPELGLPHLQQDHEHPASPIVALAQIRLPDDPTSGSEPFVLMWREGGDGLAELEGLLMQAALGICQRLASSL